MGISSMRGRWYYFAGEQLESSCEWAEEQEAAGQTQLSVRHEVSTTNNLANIYISKTTRVPKLERGSGSLPKPQGPRSHTSTLPEHELDVFWFF